MQQSKNMSQQEQLLAICRVLITECRELEEDIQAFLNSESQGNSLETLVANRIDQIERIVATAKTLTIDESHQTEA
jgi:hypothetical protein